MAIAYELVNPTLGTDAAIGLMANIVAEGDCGVVEYEFSREHDHGFSLPSGESKITTYSDLNYLENCRLFYYDGSMREDIEEDYE